MGCVDAGEALTELTGRSAEIEQVAILDGSGGVLAATPEAAGDRLRKLATELLEVARSVRTEAVVEKVEVNLAAGSVFLVQANEHVAVATTRREPLGALVVYDLRSCLGRIDPPAPTKPVRRRRRKADTVDA